MDVKHVAKLANLPLTETEEKKFTSQFSETLKTIAVINELDTTGVSPTFQVTGLTNVSREDKIDTNRILKQSQVLDQSPASYQGFIVVPSIFNEQ